jgi:broad specificity phosphatase PhoE
LSEVILVRHGETEWNVAEIFRGRLDIELNETGIRQAGLLGEYLRQADVDAVYSSPLRRARRTAEIVASHHNITVTVAPGLTDLDFGQWQGLSHREVADNYRELYALWHGHPEQVRMPAGESLGQARARALEVVNEAIARYERRVILVSHRVVNKVLICALLGLDNSHFWQIRLDTCGLSSFSHTSGQFTLTRHNDTSFLARLGSAPQRDF